MYSPRSEFKIFISISHKHFVKVSFCEKKKKRKYFPVLQLQALTQIFEKGGGGGGGGEGGGGADFRKISKRGANVRVTLETNFRGVLQFLIYPIMGFAFSLLAPPCT